jgi:acylphosphatase
MLLTYCIRISGKVQGVFYRQSTREKANSLGIKGTVKNLDSGEVEIIATGTRDQLNDLVKWCKEGPPRAVVERVDVEERTLTEFNQFSVTRD